MDDNDESLSRPAHLSIYAEACLQALARRGLGDKLSSGGGLGLLHYLDYRPTHDVDAWWDRDATPQERQAVVQVIGNALRSWGEVDIYPKSCTSRHCVKLTSSGKCEIIEIAQRRQVWQSDTPQN